MVNENSGVGMERLSHSILSIYDAAIDDDLWQPALDSALSYVEAPSASMHMVDMSTDVPWVMACRGGRLASWDEAELQFYTEHLAHLETEAWRYVQTRPIRTAIEDTEIWPDIQSVRNRADYSYLEKRTGLFRRLVARLNDNPRWFDAIAIQFDSSTLSIPRSVRTKTESLLPHIAKAFEMSRMYRELYERYKAVLTALDQVHVGMCVVQSSGDLLVTNAEAEKILDARDGCFLNSRKRLSCADDSVRANLEAAISSVCNTAEGMSGFSEFQISVPRRSSVNPLLIEVTPVRDSRRELGSKVQGAIITLRDPDAARPFDTTRVKSVYKLSKAEVAVCELMVEGFSNTEIADKRGVSIETVKTQAVAILQKVKVDGRSGLIRQILKTCPPVAGSVAD